MMHKLMPKCIMVKIGKRKKRKLSKKRKLNENREEFINWAEIGGLIFLGNKGNMQYASLT